ncbi:hypothetical protein ACS0TY_003962 [Phlomoides rotata]
MCSSLEPAPYPERLCSEKMLRDGPRVEEEDILDLGEVLGVRVDAGTRSPVCLVGRLFSEKGYNVFALLNVMTKVFRVKGKLSGRDWRADDCAWVLRNQPWHFDGHLFAIRDLSGREQPSHVSVTATSFWVCAYNLPFDHQSEGVLRAIVKCVGKLEYFEKSQPLEPMSKW